MQGKTCNEINIGDTVTAIVEVTRNDEEKNKVWSV